MLSHISKLGQLQEYLQQMKPDLQSIEACTLTLHKYASQTFLWNFAISISVVAKASLYVLEQWNNYQLPVP